MTKLNYLYVFFKSFILVYLSYFLRRHTAVLFNQSLHLFLEETQILEHCVFIGHVPHLLTAFGHQVGFTTAYA
jgi:hypothetical protein